MADQVERKLTFDCSAITKDNLLSISEFNDYLLTNMKVCGRRNNFGDRVAINMSGNSSIVVELKAADTGIKKIYLKYLAKKFLHTKELRDWVKVVSDGIDGYSMAYYNVDSQEDKEEYE